MGHYFLVTWLMVWKLWALKNKVESDLWPMANLYAVYIYNHTPKTMHELPMFSLVVWLHVIILKTCMFGIVLCLRLILSLSSDNVY